MGQDGVVFNRLSDTALEVRDTISNQQYRIESSEPMEIEPTEYDDFPGPVTDAIVIDAVDLTIHGATGPTVRDKDGRMKMHIGIDEKTYTTDDSCTFLELHTSVKSYLRIDGPFEFKRTVNRSVFDFSNKGQLVLGSRAWWCYPTETITVSESVTDIMEAVSHFGDSILDTSPERSFSTLRGHPPRLRVGDSLDIPNSVTRPDTGITITIPSTISAVLSVAPLAYYLSATVEPGRQFTIETESGFTYQPEYDSLHTAVQSVLTQCFYLDCLVRTEGLYQVDLQERHEFEKHAETEVDFADLYEQSLVNRTETYLQMDSDIIESITTKWPITAVVEPGTSAIESLPYLVYELAQIRPESPPRYTGDKARQHALQSFSGNQPDTRSTTLVFQNEAEFVDVPETESHQTIWVGDGVPLNAMKFVREGYNHDTLVRETETTLDKESSSSSELEVAVVCNEDTMGEELHEIRSSLTPRDNYPIDLSVYSQLSTDELRQVLERGASYLHFIGHATPGGLECTDGMLDVATIDESNVTTFFLNACQSYQQGKELVKQGSSGGIVTYSDISDRFALETSSLVIQLLKAGFAIGSCLNIVKDSTAIGGQYTTVGSHNAKVMRPERVTPHIRRVSTNKRGYELELTACVAGGPEYTVGGLITHDIEGIDRYRIIPSSTTVNVGWNEMKEFLSTRDIPVIYQGELQSRAEFFETIEQWRS